MKLFLVFLLLIIPAVLSQEISFFKEQYIPGETAQLKINLDVDLIQDLKNSQISILDLNDNIISVQPNLVNINKNSYLVYFNIPLTLAEGEYKLLINGITYRENSILKTENYIQNFIVQKKDYELIRIQPGAISYLFGDQTYKAVRVTNLETSLISIPLLGTEEIIPTISMLQIPGRSSKTFYLRVIPENIKATGIYLFSLGNNYLIPLYLAIPPKEGCSPNWQCSVWSSCVDELQTRECIDLNSCGSESNRPSEQQECEVICNPNWQCSGWTSCSNGRETRGCVDINSCGVEENKPSELQECGLICVENWECAGWAECVNGVQTRNCNDLNSCGSESNRPSEQQECEVICNPNWQCSVWSSCVDELQTRECLDLNNCNVECEECDEIQDCEIDLILETEEVNKTLKKEIVFFSDINNPRVTVNSLINENVLEDKELKGPLYIKNIGETDLSNLKISLTGNLDKIVRINITQIDLLKKGEIINQFLWINENKNPVLDEYQGSMLIESANFSMEFPIILLISRGEIEQDLEESEETLFIEDRSEKVDLVINEEDKTLLEEEKKLIKIVPPYKALATILLIILLILLYFIFKGSSRKKTSFRELVSKVEKK